MAPLAKTILAFHHLHPLVRVDLPPFVNDFHPKIDLALDRKTFIYILTHSPCLSSNSPLILMYEFSKIILPLMILLIMLILFLKYVNTSLVVMFFH
jgi:hypothetical protein